MVEGTGKAWLDEVTLTKKDAASAAGAITRVIRDFGLAGFDYTYG